MARRRRSEADLKIEFSEQRAALSASCNNYDAGARWESKRIATCIYTLFHDGTGRTKSLLTQLCRKDTLEYTSTANGNIAIGIPHSLLIINATQKKFIPVSAGFREQGGIPPWSKKVAFADWWNETVFISRDGKRLSRKNLVFAMRSQDGGAHFDEKLKEDAYTDLRDYKGETDIDRLNQMEFRKDLPTEIAGRVHEINDLKTIPHARDASVRQIAFEVEVSLANIDLN